MTKRNDKTPISASDLARMAYCERQAAFDAVYGCRSTRHQNSARKRGLRAHAAFHEEGLRIAAASATKGRCFIATMVLGDREEIRALRAFRDLYLRRNRLGRWLVARYYAFSPGLCSWLATRPLASRAVRPLLRVLGSAAAALVRRKLR